MFVIFNDLAHRQGKSKVCILQGCLGYLLCKSVFVTKAVFTPPGHCHAGVVGKALSGLKEMVAFLVRHMYSNETQCHLLVMYILRYKLHLIIACCRIFDGLFVVPVAELVEATVFILLFLMFGKKTITNHNRTSLFVLNISDIPYPHPLIT